MIRTLIIAALATLVCMPVGAAYGHGTGPYGKSVTLSDARVSADASAVLRSGARITFSHPCNVTPALGARFTETSAYTRAGGALGGQHRHGHRTVWHGQGGAVTYDRRTGTFRNGTAHSVIVAGWCS